MRFQSHNDVAGEILVHNDNSIAVSHNDVASLYDDSAAAYRIIQFARSAVKRTKRSNSSGKDRQSHFLQAGKVAD